MSDGGKKVEQPEKKDGEKKYDKYACGIFIVRADNANFNADFSGVPRELPDGRIYATDKALKYCIRKYIHDIEGEDKVFAWRRFKSVKEKIEPLDLKENIKRLSLSHKPAEDIQQKEMVEIALSKDDVRLFGATLAVEKKNISITGPCQITYGINAFKTGSAYTNAILSPYSSSEGKEKSTIGSESRATEIHYIYDFNINPNNLTHDEQIKTLFGEDASKYYLNPHDIQLFKEAITRGVNYVTSTTKVGAISELLLFVEFEKGKEKQIPLVPLLKTKITISETGQKRKIDLTEVIKSLNSYSPIHYELYYDPDYTEVEGFPSKTEKEYECFHIVKHSKL